MAQQNSYVTEMKNYKLFLEEKIQLCRDIYSLLRALMQGNAQNQEYIFELVPFFQIHSKYLPEAIEFLREVCASNYGILSRLSENLKIDFDFSSKQEKVEDNGKVIKFLINLYEDDAELMGGEERMVFRQNEKITSKPVNLIQYFMNLIADKGATLKPEYQNFLLSICKFGNIGINMNQENIYKLFKKYQAIRDEIKFDKYFKTGQLKLLSKAEELDKDFLSNWKKGVKQ